MATLPEIRARTHGLAGVPRLNDGFFLTAAPCSSAARLFSFLRSNPPGKRPKSDHQTAFLCAMNQKVHFCCLSDRQNFLGRVYLLVFTDVVKDEWSIWK
jgi:hypothetical protein